MRLPDAGNAVRDARRNNGEGDGALRKEHGAHRRRRGLQPAATGDDGAHGRGKRGARVRHGSQVCLRFVV